LVDIGRGRTYPAIHLTAHLSTDRAGGFSRLAKPDPELKTSDRGGKYWLDALISQLLDRETTSNVLRHSSVLPYQRFLGITK